MIYANMRWNHASGQRFFFSVLRGREAHADSEGGLILLITLHSASGESMCGTKILFYI